MEEVKELISEPGVVDLVYKYHHQMGWRNVMDQLKKRNSHVRWYDIKGMRFDMGPGEYCLSERDKISREKNDKIETTVHTYFTTEWGNGYTYIQINTYTAIERTTNFYLHQKKRRRNIYG